MSANRDSDLVYDWNPRPSAPPYELKLNDETLRDGLQSPSVFNPSIPEKLELLHYMEDLGVYSAAIGLPAAGPHAYADVLAIASEIASHRMKIYPYCAARTHQNDILPIIEIQQRPADQRHERVEQIGICRIERLAIQERVPSAFPDAERFQTEVERWVRYVDKGQLVGAAGPGRDRT